MTESMLDERERKSGLWQLAALVLLFAAPIVASWVMYLTGWTPSGRSNHGTLISPARPVPHAPLATWRNGKVDLAVRDGKWLLLAILPSPCGQDCRERVRLLRQVHRALARGQLHVDVALLYPEPFAPDNAEAIVSVWPEALYLLADETWWTHWDPFLRGTGVEQGAGRVYLVDPLGNLMMTYAPGQPAMDILEDLRHLLKVTQYH